MKKITLMLSIFLGVVCLLAGCGNPYARMKMSMSDKEIVLYLDTDENGERVSTSASVDVTITGAKKGVSTDVVVTNSLENIVSIETSKKGNTTKVTFTPNENVVGGQTDIVVRSKEGNLNDTIHITVYEKVKEVAFVDRNIAVADGGSITLTGYITYTPSTTNQKGLRYSLSEIEGYDQIKEYVTLDENGTLTVQEGTVTNSGSTILPYDDQVGLYYVEVGAQSEFNSDLNETKKIYVVPTIKATDVVVRSTSDSGKVTLASTLQNITVEENGESISLTQVPTYSVVLASNINGGSEFLYSRTVEFLLDTQSARRDSNYTMTLMQQKYIESDTSFVHVTKLARNAQPNDNYEYNAFRLDQIANGHDILVFKIDYTNFEGMLTTYIALDVTVQNFATDIFAYVNGDRISTVKDNPIKEGYQTINVLNTLNEGVASGNYMTLITNYDAQNKDIKLYFTLLPSPNFGADAWNNTRKHIFAVDREGNQIALDGTGYVSNGEAIYLYHDLTPSEVQYAKDKITLQVHTVYDLNPTADSDQMKFPHEVVQIFPMTIHTNVEIDNIEMKNNVLLNITSNEEQTMLITDPGIYTTNFVIGTDRRNTRVVRTSMAGGIISSSVYVDDQLLFYVIQKDGQGTEQNTISLRANSEIRTGFTYLTLKDNVHGWSFRVRVEVYAPLSYAKEEEQAYFASSIPNESRYKGQWITVSKKDIALTVGEDDTRTYQSITRLKLATTTARDKNSLKEYVPIEVYNIVKIGNAIRTIDLLSSATVSPNSSRYFYYENGRIYPFNNQYTNADAPLTLSFTVNGYDSNGQVVTLTYSIELLFVDIVEDITITTTKDVLYEKSSLGVFDVEASREQLSISCFPHATSDILARYTYEDTVIRTYTAGGSPVMVRVSDLMTLDETTGQIVVDYTKTPNGVSTVTKLQALFGSVNSVLQNIFSSSITVKVEAFAKQEELDVLYDTTYITLGYAKKVQNIMSTNLDEQGIYLEKLDSNATSAKYASKTITLSALPNEAYNKTLRVVFADSTDGNVIRFGEGQVDGEGRIVSYNNTLTFYPTNAGEITLYIAAEDSFREDRYIVGKYNPDTTIAIRVKVADGSEAYPFEISDAEDFMNIGNGYVNGVNNYHYMLANNINLGRTIQNRANLFAGLFNGSLTGLMRYTQDKVVQKTISGYRVNLVETNSSTSTNYGLFERVGEQGKLSHILLSEVDAKYTLALKKDGTLGILAGSVAGILDSNIVTGTLTVEEVNTSDNGLVIGGVVGNLSGSATSEAQDDSQPITNYSLVVKTNITNAVIGGYVGGLTGQVNGINGYANIIKTDDSKTTNIVAGGLVGTSTQASIVNTTIQAVVNADVVGGLVGIATATTFDHDRVELLDMADTKAPYALHGTQEVGGLVGRMDSSNIMYSYVRSYNQTTMLNGVGYQGDLVLSSTNGVLGGLIGSHIENNENSLSSITNSYFEGSLALDSTTDNNSTVGSLVGSSAYYVDENYIKDNYVFINSSYAKVTSDQTFTFVGNYHAVKSLVNISKIEVSGVENYSLNTTITEVDASAGTDETFVPDTQNVTVSAYQLPNDMVSAMFDKKEGYTFYSSKSENALTHIGDLRANNDGTQPHLTGYSGDKANIVFTSLTNNEIGYYIYKTVTTNENGQYEYYAIPNLTTYDSKSYQVDIDSDVYMPVLDMPRQAFVTSEENGTNAEVYVDGINTSYLYDSRTSTTTIFGENGRRVTYTILPTYQDYAGDEDVQGLWSASKIANHASVYNNESKVDWASLATYTYYLEDNTTSGYTLNDKLPVLVDNENNKLLYNILPTNLDIQVSDSVLEVTDNHYFIKDSEDEKTVVVYYNVLQSAGNEPSNNNEYYVGLKNIGSETIATYVLSVNEDFGGDARVSLSSSNPQVVRIAEGNKIVICGIGASTITVRSLLDRNVSDTFTIVTTYGIRSITLYNADNENIEAVATDNSNISQATPSIREYIKENSSFYSVQTSNSYGNNGVRYDYLAENSYKLRVTINTYEKVSDDADTPSMYFGGQLVSIRENVQGDASASEILIGENVASSFTIDNASQLAIRAVKAGYISFTLTPVITVGNKEYLLTGVAQTYTIALTNQAKDIVFDKGATSTSFAISGSGSSSELGVDFITYNANETLYMTVLDYQGNVVPFDGRNGWENQVNLSEFGKYSYRYLSVSKSALGDEYNATTNEHTLRYHFELLFDEEAYLDDLSQGQEESLNNQQYTLVFTCESNSNLRKEFSIDMHALPVSSMDTYYYPSAQNRNGEYYPQENASDYLVPSRIGLLKTNVFPILNDIDYFELTVAPEYRNYIRLTQYFDTGNGYVSYDGTRYLPDFAGIRLAKISSRSTDIYSYTGDYYVGVTTSTNCPAGGSVAFTLTGYKMVDGAPVAVSAATQVTSLEVVALPKVDLTVEGGKETILANGYDKQLTVSLSNYSVLTDGPVTFTLERKVGNDWVEELSGRYAVTEDYTFRTLEGTIGDVIRVTAHVEKVLNGEREQSSSSVTITIVSYEITGIYLQGYGTSSLELLNGTQNYLLGDITYRGRVDDTSLNDIRMLRYTWNGILSTNADRNIPFMFYDTNSNDYSNITQGATLYNNAIKFNRSESNNYFYAETLKVTNDLPFRLVLQYYYNENGVPTLYTGQSTITSYYELYYTFTITIKENSTYDRPTPIFSETDFNNLQNLTEGHYILMNNLSLTSHRPFGLNVDSLDGNGHTITLESFDLGIYGDTNTANIGLFNTIGEGTIVKNLNIDIHPLMTDLDTIRTVLRKNGSTDEQYEQALSSVKLNFSGIATVNFGLVAVTNEGTLTNIKVVNLCNDQSHQEKEYLFVYTTQDFFNGSRTNASVAGLVSTNGTSGVITNCFVGMNYATSNLTDSYKDTIEVNMAKYNREDSENSTVTSDDTDGLQLDTPKTKAFVLAGGRELAGLVGTNGGTIASSYVYGVGLLNLANLASDVFTGGVVVHNRGTIFATFVEGLSENATNLRASSDYIIESTGMSGGFAYQNSGTIYDAYANIMVSTNSGRTGDFIFTNSGTLRNCYTTAISLSLVSTKGDAGNEVRTHHGVFTGISTDLTINNTGSYSGCYYLYLRGETESKIEHAAAINGDQPYTEGAKSNFTNIDYYYGYSMGADAGNGNRDYIWGQTTVGPKLNFALLETTSIRRMILETSSAEGGWNYSYFADYAYGSIKNPILVSSGEELVVAVINNAKPGKEQGSVIFGQNTDTAHEGDGLNALPADTIRIIRDITITSTLVNQTRIDNRYLRDIIFAGVLDGNGMSVTIENLNDELYQVSKVNFGLFSQIGLTDTQIEVKNEATEGSSTTQASETTTTTIRSKSATIKNVKFNLRGNVTSTNAQNVGVLAGSVYNATIIDVTVSASDGVMVNGRNAVGGIAGVVGGGSRLLNVNSNISVSSVFDSRVVDKGNSVDLNYDFAYNRYHKGTSTIIDTDNISYAGGIAGILDVTGKSKLADALTRLNATQPDTKNGARDYIFGEDRTSLFITEQSASSIMNLRVYGYVEITGEHAGGLFGYVSETSHVKHSTFELDPTTTQRIVGHNFAGGVVAENYGYLEEVYVDASAEARVALDASLPSVAYGTGLFKEEYTNAQTAIYPTAIGGIAGLSEGAIYNSYSKANVANANAFVAGGVVGIMQGANYLSHVYTTAYVNARRVIGGVIGFVREYTDSTNHKVSPLIILDYITGYNVWDNVADMSTNNTTYTILNTLYREQYKEGDRYLPFDVRMPQVGNEQVTVVDANGEPSTQSFTWTTYLGSLIGRVGNAVVTNDSMTVGTVTNKDMQTILRTRLNSQVNTSETDETETKINAIYAELSGANPTSNNTIYTSTSNFAKPNSLPNKVAELARDKYYYEDMLGIQKTYDVLKNGLEYELDKENGGYVQSLALVYEKTKDTSLQNNKSYYKLNQNGETYEVVTSPSVNEIGNYYELKDAVDHYPIVTKMVSDLWLFDRYTSDTDRTASIYWYYDPATNLPIMIEGVSPADNTIASGDDYMSKVLIDAQNGLTNNKTYTVTGKVDDVEFHRNSTLVFEGSLQGSQNTRHTITLNADNTFNILQNANISNLTFTINCTGHEQTVHTDGHVAFGYFADYVYNSTISKVDINLIMSASVTMPQYLNMVNHYLGLVFGYVVDSTISDVKINIQREEDATEKVITLAGARYQNVGMFAGGIQNSRISDVTIGGANIIYAPNTMNSNTLNGYYYGSTTNIASFAGSVTSGSRLTKVVDAINLTVAGVNRNTIWNTARVYNFGSVAEMQSSNTERYASTGKLEVVAGDWLNGTTTNIGRLVGNANGRQIGYDATMIGELQYVSNGKVQTVNMGGLVGKDNSSTITPELQDSKQVSTLTQKVTITGDASNINFGGVVGEGVGSKIYNSIVASKFNFDVTENTNSNLFSLGGLVGNGAGVILNKVMFDTTLRAGKGTASNTIVRMGGLFGTEKDCSADTFVVRGTLSYNGTSSEYKLAGIAGQLTNNSSEGYKNGIVSPVFEKGNGTTYTLCKDGKIEPLATDSTGRIDASVKYPYELYLYEGMESMGDISGYQYEKVKNPTVKDIGRYYELNNDVYSLTTDTEINSNKTYYSNIIKDINGMRYVDFIDTYYKASNIEKGSIQDIFGYALGEEYTRYNPRRVKENASIGNTSKSYFIVDGEYTVTFGTTFNGVLIGANTQDNVATSSSTGITNNGIIANVKFTDEQVFDTNNGVLFNVMLEKDDITVSGDSGALVTTNNGYIFHSSVVSSTVTLNNNSALIANTNSGRILYSYAIGNLNEAPAIGDSIYALVASNSGTVKSSYYAGNIPTVIGGEATKNVSSVYADKYALGGNPSSNGNIQYLPTTGKDSMQSLDTKVSAFAHNESLQFNYGYPYILGGMRLDEGTITDYTVYNQADWLLVMGSLQDNKVNGGVTVNIAADFTFENINNLTGYILKGNEVEKTYLTINGNNHTITVSAKIGNTGNNFGLISSAEFVTVRNLTVEYTQAQSLVSGTSNAGGLIGEAKNITIYNVTVSGLSVTGTATALGGVIGSGTNVITNAITASNIYLNNTSSNADVGAFAGSMSGLTKTGVITITSPTLTGGQYVGGAIGKLTGALNNTIKTENNGSITAGATVTAGGLIGKWDDASGNAILTNTGIEMIGGSNNVVGGLVGELTLARDFTIANWEIGAAVTSTGSASVGGLIGKVTGANHTLTINSITTQDKTLSSTGNLGGLIGTTNSHVRIGSAVEIAQSFSTGAESAGGLIGEQTAGTLTIANTVTIANSIAGTEYAGGLIGSLNGSLVINNKTITLSNGSVTATSGHAGGLVGCLNGTTTIEKLTINGNNLNIKANENAGGLFGRVILTNNSSIDIASITPMITVRATNDSAGGLVGRANGIVNLTLSVKDIQLGTIEAQLESGDLERRSAGGLIGSASVNVILGDITISNFDTISIKANAHAGGILGYTSKDVTVNGNIVWGPNSVVNNNYITASSTSGGLFGYITSSLTVRPNKTITIQNLTMTVPDIASEQRFGVVVGQTTSVTSDGTITINNVSVSTAHSYVGLVAGYVSRNMNGRISINNSTLSTDKVNAYSLGLVVGWGDVTASSIKLEGNNKLVLPDRDKDNKTTRFDFDDASNKGYSNGEIVAMIDKTVNGDYNKLWIQNGRNEDLNKNNNKWFGILSKDTRTTSYGVISFPYWMAWGDDDTVIVSTSGNYVGRDTVSVNEYFGSLNINATFVPTDKQSYSVGLISGYGSIPNSGVAISENTKIETNNGRKVKIGSFNKMVFNYMEHEDYGYNKWLVMEFSYYIDNKQLTNNISYRFTDDWESTKEANRSRIEVKFAMSYTPLGNDVKPEAGTWNVFSYQQPYYTYNASNGGSWSRSTKETKYAYITSDFFKVNRMSNYVGHVEDSSNWSWHQLLFTEKRVGALGPNYDIRGLIQYSMGYEKVGRRDAVGLYPDQDGYYPTKAIGE